MTQDELTDSLRKLWKDFEEYQKIQYRRLADINETINNFKFESAYKQKENAELIKEVEKWKMLANERLNEAVTAQKKLAAILEIVKQPLGAILEIAKQPLGD
jgi:hypothetical protein